MAIILAKQEQKQKIKSKKDVQEDVNTSTVEKTDATNVDTEAIDDLLDEIDNVLEANAEEFVSQYIQRGGQ